MRYSRWRRVLDSAESIRDLPGLAIVSRNNAMRRDEIQTELGYHLPKIECVAPASLEDLHRIVRESQSTARVLIAVGGDGTLHQVLNACDPARQMLGILPMGTGNDFARLIGYGGDLAHRAKQLAGLTPQPTDYGTVAGIRYINSAGIGLDSATLALRLSLPRAIARNYTLAFVCTLAGMQPLRGQISADRFERSGAFWWLLAMNNQFIGGGTRITPHARIDDGLLDMLLVERIPKPALLALMPRALKGTHLGRRGVVHGQYAQVTLRLEDIVDWLAVDGELYPLAGRELQFTCQAGGLQFLR